MSERAGGNEIWINLHFLSDDETEMQELKDFMNKGISSKDLHIKHYDI